MSLTQKKKDLLKQEWLKLSSAWIKETREGRNSHRNGLLDQPMLEACGYVEGLRILDCGCGLVETDIRLLEKYPDLNIHVVTNTNKSLHTNRVHKNSLHNNTKLIIID